MENFRDFTIGPDPFGRTWQVQFKYLQTAISIRHSDSVDVCFLLQSGDERLTRTVVILHPDIRQYAARSGRKIEDAWCSRLAMCKLRQAVLTAEDLEREYLTVTPAEIQEFDSAIRKWEEQWLREHAA